MPAIRASNAALYDAAPQSYRMTAASVPPGADRFLVAEPQPGDKTVAVLPFRNAGPAEDEYLAEELMDDLIDSLSMTRGLKVRSRGAVLKFKGAQRDPRDMGRELGVQVVVEGSVRRARGNVRISARLISVADGFQLWARRFDRPEKDVLSINDDAASAIAEALTVDRESRVREVPTDPAAIDLYLRARHEYRKFWVESQDQALELFAQAEALAPGDPMILSGKAMALARRAFFDGEGVLYAREVAEEAVAAAPDLAEARLALGSVLLQTGEWKLAARELRHAISRGPGLAEAHATLGRLLIEIGALEEGTRRLEAALSLDPKVPLACGALARGYVLLGDWNKFDDRVGMVRESAGEVAYYTCLARMLLWRRDRERAAEALRQLKDEESYMRIPQMLLELVAESRLPVDLLSRPPEAHAHEGGRRRRTFLMQLEAEVYAYLGDAERTFDALGRVTDAGLIDIIWLERCPLFEAIRQEPQFSSIRALVKPRADEILEAYRLP
jgi:TolB-like protein/thioredoxin-like negative regulator of GroEL